LNFLTSVKLDERWAKCLNQYFKFSLGINLWYIILLTIWDIRVTEKQQHFIKAFLRAA